MQTEETQSYCRVMEEIKRRNIVLGHFLSGANNAVFRATTVECMCLQLRKTLELIAFASLVANKEVYSSVYENFRRAWNAKRLLKELEEVNPHFYPEPIIEEPSRVAGIKRNLVARTDGFLTQSDFVEAYEVCGGAMHAENPFGRRLDYGMLETRVAEWRNRVVALLNTHKIRVLGHEGFFLVHMKEARDDSVHCYEFVKKDEGVA